MENIKKIFELLKTIQGNGSFETSGIKKITLPGLNINGIGEIGFPISPMQIREIIKISKKAPFGKGSKTITDTAVRSAWELNASQLSFYNEDWKDFVEQILKNVKTGLGIEKDSITVSLYKLLIYEEGDFFLPHKDSEKEPGMFGTLIIGLPSIHTGGELVIRFDSKEKIIDFSLPSSNYKIPYAAFFADCDHEIKPITSGYRVCLVYNLLQTAGSRKLEQLAMSAQIDQMAILLKSMATSIANNPKAVLLEHQYTPANFSLNSLKHHDKPRADLLLEAAKKAGYFAELGLVTHYKTGELIGSDDEYSYRSNYRNRSDEDFGNGTMGEVYEEYTAIEHWGDGKIPTLGMINIGKEDLISDFEIGEDNPIEEEEEGFTGNAGMTIEYWYHYGAIILWPKSKHLELLFLASVSVRLAWLEYYYQNWDLPELNSLESSKQILIHISQNELTEGALFSDDFTIVAKLLLKLDDGDFILDNCESLLTRAFKNIHIKSWIGLLQHFGPEIYTNVFENAINKGDAHTLNHVLEILSILSSLSSTSLTEFFQQQIDQIPTCLSTIQLSKLKNQNKFGENENGDRKDIIRAILKKVMELSIYKEKDTKWILKTADVITKLLPRNYVNKVLVVIVSNEKGLLAKEILQTCVLNLRDRTGVKPSPPPNWKRSTPDTKEDIEIWKILRPFIESEEAQVFEYRKAQSYRSDMERAISRVKIDFKMETIKKSSPHILKITKTQAAYERALKNWEEDLAILQTLL